MRSNHASKLREFRDRRDSKFCLSANISARCEDDLVAGIQRVAEQAEVRPGEAVRMVLRLGLRMAVVRPEKPSI